MWVEETPTHPCLALPYQPRKPLPLSVGLGNDAPACLPRTPTARTPHSNLAQPKQAHSDTDWGLTLDSSKNPQKEPRGGRLLVDPAAVDQGCKGFRLWLD